MVFSTLELVSEVPLMKKRQLVVSLVSVLTSLVMAQTPLQAQETSLLDFQDDDLRLYVMAGATNSRQMTFDYPNLDGEVDVWGAASATVGVERDILLGFGVGFQAYSTRYGISRVNTAPSWLTPTYVNFTDAHWKATSFIPTLHYRLDNEVLEPYIKGGFGVGVYEFTGETSSGTIKESDTGLVGAVGVGLDYLTEGGFMFGLAYDLHLHREVNITKGAAAHTFGLRLGLELR